MPIDADKEFTGTFFTCSTRTACSAACRRCSLFVTHGAVFLALKTEGEIRERANRTAWLVGLPTALAAVAFLAWAQVLSGSPLSIAAAVLAAGAFVVGLVANRLEREGLAFLGTALAIAFAVISLFVALFPDVMPSSTDPAYTLTITNASSTTYTLTIMTVVAVVFTPIVLVYQGWTYWVFRKRVASPPVAVES